MEAERGKTLQTELKGDRGLRPVLTSLNGDNGWLMSFPRPQSERASTGKVYFHMMFEPWLNGPATQVSSWVINLQQSQVAALPDPESIYAVIGQVEAAAKLTFHEETKSPTPAIDAIFIGLHLLDHLHKPTLQLFDPRIPVIATPEAIAILKPWNHFTTILSISSFDATAKSWRDESLHPGTPFPSWLAALRLPGAHYLNFVTAIVWTHSTATTDEVHEAILQTPHGTTLDVGPLQAFLDSKPPTQKLAMLHGLKESAAIGYTNTFGTKGGLALYRRIGGAKYWVKTHNLELAYSLFMRMVLWVSDTPRTVEWALEQEAKESGGAEVERPGGTPKLIEVANGGCFVLA